MCQIYINAYSCICCLGDDIQEIFKNSLRAEPVFFTEDSEIIKGVKFPFGKVKKSLPQINDPKYNLRCNQLLVECSNRLKKEIDALIVKYGKYRVGVVIGTTNSGVDEFECSGDIDHSQIGNPAGFLVKYLGLKGYYSGVSTACTSGIKAFSTAKKLVENDVCDAVIVGATDALSKMPIFGFHSLEVLSQEKTIPFSQNRNGINIGEGAALFILEKNKCEKSIEILGMGETSDAYHAATPDPDGIQASIAIEQALKEANLLPSDIDYINLHGTGTHSNDLMEANAVFRVFGDKIPSSSTKSLTGHCLGASSAVESALCCAILDQNINKEKYLIPHCYDGVYDAMLPTVNLVSKNQKTDRLKYCLCNAFGFGGSNAVMILGVSDE